MNRTSVPNRIRAVNALLPQGFGRLKLTSADALEASARRSTGKKSELTPESRDALAELLKSYQKTAKLHELGEIVSAVNVISMLKTQLRLNAAAADEPGILNRQIRAPLIITGLPRTGSTLLHNLLAQDPQWRVPWSWEASHPVPRAQSSLTENYRIALTQASYAAIEILNPGFKAIHELDARLPQECLVITAIALRSHMFFSSNFVPDYQDWLDEQPAEALYDSHRLFLQYLQGESDARWALKAPSHLFSIDGLLNAYPDARLVYTRRDPEEVIGSIASLHWHLYRTFSNFDDLPELGRQVSRRWGHAQQQFHNRLSDSAALQRQTFTIDYSRLTKDPVSQIKALYKYFELSLAPVAEKAMLDYLKARPQQKFGKHRYDLSDYGLTVDQVRADFGVP